MECGIKRGLIEGLVDVSQASSSVLETPRARQNYLSNEITRVVKDRRVEICEGMNKIRRRYKFCVLSRQRKR